MLTDTELKFLTRLRDEFASQGGFAVCKTNPPAAPMQSLVDRGYCCFSKARSGPLGIYTGEVMIGLTEAGKAAIEAPAAVVA